MKQLRLDAGQEPQLGPARSWTRHGYGTLHVTTWVRGGEMRECRTPGCAVRFIPLRVCYCGNETDPLQWGE